MFFDNICTDPFNICGYNWVPSVRDYYKVEEKQNNNDKLESWYLEIPIIFVWYAGYYYKRMFSVMSVC